MDKLGKVCQLHWRRTFSKIVKFEGDLLKTNKYKPGRSKILISFCNFLELYFCLFKAYHFKFWQWYRQIVPDWYSSNVEKTEEGSVTCKNLCNTLTCSRSYTVYLIYPSLKFMSIYMYYQHAKIQQSKVFFAHSAGTL